MGEPGTKDILSLDELDAVAGLRTGRKHILSILVENKPGVLTRITGLFARRGFNIDTLAVGPTDDETLSRITLTLDGGVHHRRAERSPARARGAARGAPECAGAAARASFDIAHAGPG